MLVHSVGKCAKLLNSFNTICLTQILKFPKIEIIFFQDGSGPNTRREERKHERTMTGERRKRRKQRRKRKRRLSMGTRLKPENVQSVYRMFTAGKQKWQAGHLLFGFVLGPDLSLPTSTFGTCFFLERGGLANYQLL